MINKQQFGTWPSAFTLEAITANAKTFYELVVADNNIYWLEMRPEEQGRGVIVKEHEELTPPEFNVRSRVQEYGGGSFAVQDGVIYFVNNSDQQIYTQQGSSVKKLTNKYSCSNENNESNNGNNNYKFANLLAIEDGLIAVAEKGLENLLVFIDYQTGEIIPLHQGQDFYAAPVLSPDGTKLAWISWQHPFMPWDQTTLWLADWRDGELHNVRVVISNDNESILEPKWSKDNQLFVVSDRSNWWNIYKLEINSNENNYNLINICELSAEFTLPLWVHGQANWLFWQDSIVAAYRQGGCDYLGIIDIKKGAIKNINLPGVVFRQLHVGNDFIALIQGQADDYDKIIKLDCNNLINIDYDKLINIDGNKIIKSIACAKDISQLNLQAKDISIPEYIEYQSGNNRQAKALYYPPANSQYQGLDGTLPPLIVKIHGGPTAHAVAAFDPKIQFWTSRGFAVVDINYAGSTGYGREYRRLLYGNWGIFDAEDCENAAKFLVAEGLVDSNKLFIRGSSAGGYTVLNCLIHSNIFKAGASYYGVNDLQSLIKTADQQGTHKFESHYLDQLIGEYPKEKERYDSRSPINNVDNLQVPVIFFQGEDDKVVPKEQAILMADALKKRKVPYKLIIYPGEQHGFKKAATIQQSLQQELEFYLKKIV